MKFQVFVPPLSEDEFAMTFQVDAKDWMAALRQIVMRISADGKMIPNLMCDVKEDNTFHVTDPKSGRVFQVKSLDDGGGDSKETKAATAPAEPAAEQKPEPAVVKKEEPPVEKAPEKREPAPAAVETRASDAPVAEASPKKEKVKKKKHRDETPREESGAPMAAAAAAASASAAAAAPPAPVAPAPVVTPAVADKEAFADLDKTGPQQIGRAVTEAEWNAEELLAQVFEEIQDLYMVGEGTSASARFALDLALKHVRCESGAVLLADVKAKELAFAAASGPKAREVLSFRVPMGQGIAGFCAQESVTIAVSAVEKDPRFFRKIADALGYETKSILCAPIVANGRTVGVLEVLNRYLGSSFAPAEVNVVSYIAARLGEHLGEKE